MKIAVTGKGGVGKTTFTAVLSRLYADEGRTVLAVDADPDANLGMALGFTEEELNEVVPITKMRELIKERTNSTAETFGKFFKINPKVDDIPDMMAKVKNGVKLLLLGTVEDAGSGCVCPENVLLKRIITHLILRSDDVVILDMEAGLEHLARGTTDCMDSFIVVVEPGERSIQTYHKVSELAADLGITDVKVVANKVRGPEDEEYLKSRIPDESLLGFIHYNDDVIAADRSGRSPYDFSDKTVDEIRAIKAKIDSQQ